MPAPIAGVAVAGLGAIGRVHAANLAGRVARARLARVMDAAEPAARRLGALHDVPWSTSYEDLLEDAGVEAVVIATPPSTHPEMAMLAAAAGKHVFCEKPLALEVSLGEGALAAAERAGVLLQVGFQRRFDRHFVHAKSRIAAGELGEVYTFFDSMRDMRPPPIELLRAGEQTLLHDTACHNLDAARWLVGEIDEITTVGAALTSPAVGEIGQIDHAVTLLRFETGALGIVENSLASGYGFDCRCELVGSEATVRLDSPHVADVQWLSGGRGCFDRTPTFLDRFADAYVRELESFAGAVEGRSDVVVGGADGLAAVVLASAAETSLEQGRTVRLRRRRENGGLRYAFV